MVTSCETEPGEVRSGPMTRQRSKLHNLTLPPSLPCGKSLPTLSGDGDTIKTRYSSNVVVWGSESKSQGRTKGFEKARWPAVRLGDLGRKSSAGDEDYGGLNAFREQLMSDLRSEIKLEFMKQCWNDDLAKPAPAMQLDVGLSVAWNLRSKRDSLTTVTVVDEIEKNEKKSMSGQIEKRGRERFPICLSKNEIEEDFMAMVGRRPPHRPYKRKKIVQQELDGLFPGSGLTHVTLGKYKVPHPS